MNEFVHWHCHKRPICPPCPLPTKANMQLARLLITQRSVNQTHTAHIFSLGQTSRHFREGEIGSNRADESLPNCCTTIFENELLSCRRWNLSVKLRKMIDETQNEWYLCAYYHVNQWSFSLCNVIVRKHDNPAALHICRMEAKWTYMA